MGKIQKLSDFIFVGSKWMWMVTASTKLKLKDSPWENSYVKPRKCVFFLSNLIFDWRKIALQNFAVFCKISTWISHRYTHVPSFLNLPPISLLIPPLWVVIEPLFEFPESYSKFPMTIYFTYSNVSFHVTLSLHLTLSFLPSTSVSISLFSMSVSPLLPCKRLISTIFLDFMYMH